MGVCSPSNTWYEGAKKKTPTEEMGAEHTKDDEMIERTGSKPSYTIYDVACDFCSTGSDTYEVEDLVRPAKADEGRRLDDIK
jgi:hypothetical protein